MSRLIIALFVIIFSSFITVVISNHIKVGEPLRLTPFIEKGVYHKAKGWAEVRYDEFKNIKSYSGFITVTKTHNYNIFFWFILSQSSNPYEDPVILWSDGGPGSSAMSTLFNYNGPFSITKDQKVEIRRNSITRDHNVIYVDNPVGMGFSHTQNDLGYSRTQDDVGRDLLAFLEQFFKLFSEFRKNDFYVGSDSFGGNIAMSRFLKNYNSNATEEINFQGLMMGNALVDPAAQQNRADFLYYLGLVDWNQRKLIKELDDEVDELGKRYDSTKDSQAVAKLTELNQKRHNLVLNITGFTETSYALEPYYPENLDYFITWIQLPEIRRVLHVGNKRFDQQSHVVKKFMKDDIERSIVPQLAQAFEEIRVLAYSGQMDLSFPYPSTENFYSNLKWSGAMEYRNANRELWYSNGTLAGYRKKVGNVEEVMVRNAGRAVAYYQPAWFCDLITQFTHNKF